MKEGSSDDKKVRKRRFFKEHLTEWFFVEPKMFLLWHCCEEPFKHLYTFSFFNIFLYKNIFIFDHIFYYILYITFFSSYFWSEMWPAYCENHLFYFSWGMKHKWEVDKVSWAMKDQAQSNNNVPLGCAEDGISRSILSLSLDYADWERLRNSAFPPLQSMGE